MTIPASCCKARPVFYFGLAVLLALVSGCTTIPSKEFASYKDSFAQARKASEDVLVDYGAALGRYQELKAKRAAAAKQKPKERGEPFDPNAISTQSAGVDPIAVRMKAWDVVSRYNDLLVALAQGKAADDLAGAVDGLSSSLGSFPIAEVAASWTEVSGYLAPLKPLALEAVREQSRRQFVAAVGKASPLITDKFLKLLKQDAADFYQFREKYNDLEYLPAADQVAFAYNRYVILARHYQLTPQMSNDLKAMNAQVATLPRFKGGAPAVETFEPDKLPPGTTAPTADVFTQLDSLKADLDTRVAQALAKDAELDAYRQVLVHYVDLLNQLEHSMRALLAATEQAQPAVPQGADLERSVILLREAYMKYKDIGKE